MTAASAFRIALIAVGVALTLLMLGIVLAKGIRDIHDRRHAALVVAVRPTVLAALDDADSADDTAALTGRRRAVAEAMAISLLPQLRGADRDALSQLLVATGMTERAMDGLASPWAGRRRRSAELLGAAGHRPAGGALIGLLSDKDRDVRIAAARALGRIGDATAVRELFAALDRRRVPTNTAAMAVLRIGTPGAPAILDELHSDTPRTRATAAELASSLGIMAARLDIESLLADESGLVRTSAARSLGRLASPSSVAPLMERLESILIANEAHRSNDEVVAMITALGHIGERSCIPLLEAALSHGSRVTAAAGTALAHMGRRRSSRSVAARAQQAAAPRRNDLVDAS